MKRSIESSVEVGGQEWKFILCWLIFFHSWSIVKCTSQFFYIIDLPKIGLALLYFVDAMMGNCKLRDTGLLGGTQRAESTAHKASRSFLGVTSEPLSSDQSCVRTWCRFLSSNENFVSGKIIATYLTTKTDWQDEKHAKDFWMTSKLTNTLATHQNTQTYQNFSRKYSNASRSFSRHYFRWDCRLKQRNWRNCSVLLG